MQCFTSIIKMCYFPTLWSDFVSSYKEVIVERPSEKNNRYKSDTVHSNTVYSNFAFNSKFCFKSAYDLIKDQSIEQQLYDIIRIST